MNQGFCIPSDEFSSKVVDSMSIDSKEQWVGTEATMVPRIDRRKTYAIGDLAREFGVTLRTLRFYELRGLLSPPS